MHPELYHALHQQRERELEQRLARDLVRRETAGTDARRQRSGVPLHRVAAGSSALAGVPRARLRRLRTTTVAVDCCVAA